MFVRFAINQEEIQEVVLYSVVKEQKTGFGSAFIFILNFASTINHSPANLSFVPNLETSDYDTKSPIRRLI